MTALFAEQLKKRDVYAGVLMTLIGAGISLNTYSNYRLGTLTQMGPGLFPLMLGVAMTFVGMLILGSAVATGRDENETVLPAQREWRGWACILAGPVCFIVLGEYFGLAAATFGCVFVSALGERSSSVKEAAILAAIVTVVGCVLFSLVLRLNFPILRWDF